MYLCHYLGWSSNRMCWPVRIRAQTPCLVYSYSTGTKRCCRFPCRLLLAWRILQITSAVCTRCNFILYGGSNTIYNGKIGEKRALYWSSLYYLFVKIFVLFSLLSNGFLQDLFHLLPCQLLIIDFDYHLL